MSHEIRLWFVSVCSTTNSLFTTSWEQADTLSYDVTLLHVQLSDTQDNSAMNIAVKTKRKILQL